MEKQLIMLPGESLRALERAVAQKFNWRILTGGGNDQPRFVIEKQVSYSLLRGWSMKATHRITGNFQKSKNGETTLYYVISGESGVPFFQASLILGVLLLMPLFLFPIARTGNGVGTLLLLIMFATMGLYGWFAYSNYQGHLSELNRFMEDFAQRHRAPSPKP